MRASNSTIQQNVKLKERFERDALMDGLTGLHNRRLLTQVLEQRWQGLVEEHDRLTLVMIDLDAVGAKISEKMVRRHPHVFGDRQVDGSAEVMRNWEDIKREERAGEPEASVLDGVPESLPALLKAFRMTEKAAAVGFDWRKPVDVMEKMREEMAEIEAELALGDEVAHAVPVSSTKSMTGHLLGAAGALEAAAAILAMRTGVLPPTINYETPDPECPIHAVTDGQADPGSSFVNLNVTPQGQASAVMVRGLH